MTKMELIDAIAEETDQYKKDVKEIVDNAFDTIMEYLGEEAGKVEDDRENVQIIGFGTFEVSERAERKGRNPQTGEEITIPERKVPVFRVGKTFKDSVDN